MSTPNPALWNFKKSTNLVVQAAFTQTINHPQKAIIVRSIDPASVVYTDTGSIITAKFNGVTIPIMGGSAATAYVDGANCEQKQAALKTALGIVVTSAVVTSINGVAQ